MERKLGVSVFSSLFMWGGISPVESDFERQSQRKNYSKNGFSFAGSHLPCRKFIWSEDLLFSFLVSCINQELFCFSFDLFFFLLSSNLRSGILLFLFFSFFSFLPYRFLIGNSGFSIRSSFVLCSSTGKFSNPRLSIHFLFC